MSDSQTNFIDNTDDQITYVVVRLLLQQAFILDTVSATGAQHTRFAQVKKLRMLAQIDHRELHHDQFHRGVTAIGVHHPGWRALAHQVLGALLRIDDRLVNPSDSQALIAEAMWSDPASIVNPTPQRSTFRKPDGFPANCDDVGRGAVRSIIMTCPDLSVADADRAAARAHSLSRRGWRVLLLCDDATTLGHRHPDWIDQIQQTRGITPWLLKKICEKETAKLDVYNLGFVTAIAPDDLRRSWKRGITWAALKVLLEEKMSL